MTERICDAVRYLPTAVAIWWARHRLSARRTPEEREMRDRLGDAFFDSPTEPTGRG